MHSCKSISSRRAAEWRDAASSAHPRSPISPRHDLYFSTLLHSGSALIPEQPFEPEETSQEIAAVFFLPSFTVAAVQQRERERERGRAEEVC